MSFLEWTLLHLDFSGRRLTCFPLAVTQLKVLECLNAERNDFAELPVAITALSRLRELRLGRVLSLDDPMQLREERALDVRALGDLSGFPALCELAFGFCEVTMCQSMLGAAQHTSLASLSFWLAYPAPECALMVLNLRQALRGLRRGSVLSFTEGNVRTGGPAESAVLSLLRTHSALQPFYKFKTALEACGM